jgi:hypothetical protein
VRCWKLPYAFKDTKQESLNELSSLFQKGKEKAE